VSDIPPRSRKKIVDAKDIVASREKSLAQMRSQKAGAASNKNSFVHDFPPAKILSESEGM